MIVKQKWRPEPTIKNGLSREAIREAETEKPNE